MKSRPGLVQCPTLCSFLLLLLHIRAAAGISQLPWLCGRVVGCRRWEMQDVVVADTPMLLATVRTDPLFSAPELQDKSPAPPTEHRHHRVVLVRGKDNHVSLLKSRPVRASADANEQRAVIS